MVIGNQRGEVYKRTEKEYRQLPLLSSSDLRVYTTDLKKFYKTKILGEKVAEEYSRSSLIGKLVHCLLLEEDKFDDKFYLSGMDKMPTGKMLAFVEALYRHTSTNIDEDGRLVCDFILVAGDAYIDSGFKLSLETVLKKFAGSHAEDYYNQLLSATSKGLEVVTMADINIANKIADLTRKDDIAGYLFSGNHDDGNELQIEDFEVIDTPMKAMIDKIEINHQGKWIQIWDLKVVYDIYRFYQDYYLGRKSYIQGYIYQQALLSGKADIGFDYSSYKILPPKFIVVDSGCFYRPLIFPMTDKLLKEAYKGFYNRDKHYPGVVQILDNITWHKETGIWNIHPEEYVNHSIKELA